MDFKERPTVNGADVALLSEAGVALADDAPEALASAAAVGDSTEAARENHVHPTTGLMVAGTGTSTKIWVQETEPATPATGDLWFW